MESQIFQFRDPIHGFIEVTEDERKIIDSAPFQRLRNIRQLATTYLVYHGVGFVFGGIYDKSRCNCSNY